MGNYCTLLQDSETERPVTLGDAMGDPTVSGAVIRFSTAKILESVYCIDGSIIITNDQNPRLFLSVALLSVVTETSVAA